jgi:hypothetical protein
LIVAASTEWKEKALLPQGTFFSHTHQVQQNIETFLTRGVNLTAGDGFAAHRQLVKKINPGRCLPMLGLQTLVRLEYMKHQDFKAAAMYMKPSTAHLGSLLLLSLGKVHLELGNVAHEQDLRSLFSNPAEDFLILPRCAQPCPSNPVWAGHAIRELSLHMFTQSARTTAAPAFTYKRCPIHIHQQIPCPPIFEK